jgi:hypothetical protein
LIGLELLKVFKMKKIILSISVVFFTMVGYGQLKQTKNLTHAFEQLIANMIDPVQQELENILADSLSYGHSGGLVETKNNFIEKLIGGKSDFVSIEITDQKIQLYKNTGIITHNLSAVTNDNGKPGTVKLHVLLVWVKKGKLWQLAARQAVKII